MSLFDTIKDFFFSRRNQAARTVYGIAQRVAAGEVLGEAEAATLEAALATRALATPDLDALVADMRARPALEKLAAEIPARAATRRKSRDAMEDHQVETRRIIKERDAAQRVLNRVFLAASSQLEIAQKAQADLCALDERTRNFLSEEAPDRDGMFLCMSGSSLEGAEGAPRIFVDRDLFQTERTRRAYIMLAAQDAAWNAHPAKVAAWEKSAPRKKIQTPGGRIIEEITENPPAFVPPTWAELARLPKSERDRLAEVGRRLEESRQTRLAAAPAVA